MDWVKPEFGEFLAPPKKRQKTDDSSTPKANKCSQVIDDEPNISQISNYNPKTKDELVVHKKKIEEVEYWLKNIDQEDTYLLITGPPGCGKLKTLSVLCKSMNIDCVEWNCPTTLKYDPENHSLYQNELEKFEEFIIRASRYTNVLLPASRRLVVVKDIPNTFTRDSNIFQSFLDKFFGIKNVHVAFIVSDNNICRNLFPEQLKIKYCIKNINFNPITQKSVLIALNNLIKKFSLSKVVPQAESYANEISAVCNGDLRNAITTLHFLLAKGKSGPTVIRPIKKKLRGKSKIPISSENISNLVSDGKIDLFHGLGRVLYAKKENNKLSHNPQEIADSFTSSPKLFVGMLHENYLHTFSSIHDVAEASKTLVVSDLLLQDWNENSMLLGCGISVAAHGLMICNTAPIKRFQQFNKSQAKNETILSETKWAIESSNSTWKGNDVLLDIAPYASNIPYLSFDQKQILKKLAQFS